MTETRVVFHDVPVDYDIYDKNNYLSTVKNIFSIVQRYFKYDEILIKYTPSRDASADFNHYGHVAPKYIPCQWFHKKNTIL